MRVFDFTGPPNFKLLNYNLKKGNSTDECDVLKSILSSRGGHHGQLPRAPKLHVMPLFRTTVKPVYFEHFWLHWKPTKLYRWLTYRNHVALWKLNCANVRFRVQRRTVALESRYVKFSMNKNFKYCNESVDISQAINNNPQGNRLRGRPENRRWNCAQILIEAKLKTGKRSQK